MIVAHLAFAVSVNDLRLVKSIYVSKLSSRSEIKSKNMWVQGVIPGEVQGEQLWWGFGGKTPEVSLG